MVTSTLADHLVDSRLMSAFPDSGRSDWQILGEFKVRFRPKAVIETGSIGRHERTFTTLLVSTDQSITEFVYICPFAFNFCRPFLGVEIDPVSRLV